jgi:hypothetical protein
VTDVPNGLNLNSRQETKKKLFQQKLKAYGHDSMASDQLSTNGNTDSSYNGGHIHIGSVKKKYK